MNICLICCEDIEIERGIDHHVYYFFNNQFKKLEYCYDCFQLLLKTIWPNYIKKLKTIDCDAGLKRLIDEGPPIYFKDTCIENNQNIKLFFYKNMIIPGKLDISLDIKQFFLILHK